MNTKRTVTSKFIGANRLDRYWADKIINAKRWVPGLSFC